MRGTQTGRLVEQMGIGWVLDHDPAALAALLRHLVEAPEELAAVRARMRQVLPTQTWQARARTVAEVLGAQTPAAGPAPAAGPTAEPHGTNPERTP